VLAQGRGNYDPARDVGSYNLVEPLLKNTVQVPRLGWAAIRFVADNPGAWFMHCHFEFHLAMGMATVFDVANGPMGPCWMTSCLGRLQIFQSASNI
jgi:laccase